jgi:hypothetical protein
MKYLSSLIPSVLVNIEQYLPFLIPLALAEIGLTVAALVHIFKHKTYARGSRALWVILSFVQIVGPVLYFVVGREDAD